MVAILVFELKYDVPTETFHFEPLLNRINDSISGRNFSLYRQTNVDILGTQQNVSDQGTHCAH